MSPRKRPFLDSVLTTSASAVCILDDERRIRFFSPGMEQLTGWASDDFQGLVCDVGTRPTPDIRELLTSALAPGIDVLQGQPASVQTVLPRENGSTLPVVLTFLPVQNEAGQVERILVLCSEGSLPAIGAGLAQRLHAEITALRLEFRKQFAADSWIGSSPSIRRAQQQAQLLSPSELPYSIVGPPGSGRRHLAKMIHVQGTHADCSFVPLACRLLTRDQLLDTLRQMKELSGEHNRPHHQHTGTLALIDCDHCPTEIQRWLLTERSQGNSTVRLVSISEQPLESVVEQGWMDADFADMFSGVRIRIPGLHERPEDIPLLAQHFVEVSRRQQQTSAEGFTDDVLEQLEFYRWPGNVRELQQVISDACQNSFETMLTADDLPFAFRAGLEAQQLPPSVQETEQSLEQILNQFEIDVLTQTLAACRGNKADAARRLGLTRPKLYRRLKTLGMDTEDL
ncbi:MAG: helix-turn-helix domain-containing protein [Planctomycetaceae bacterium]